MRRLRIAALLRLLLIAGSASLANQQRSETRRSELSQIWVEVPQGHVALGGDVRVKVKGTVDSFLRLRLARDDDDGRATLATLPLALDTEGHFSIPCGYFSRGGTYFIELVSDRHNFLEDEETYTDLLTNSVERNSISDSFDNFDTSNSSSVSETVTELGETIVKTWKFEVKWPVVKLSVTPEQIQTYPERPVTAILEFPEVVCPPVESNADYWLELLYCGHTSGGAVLCDGRNASSHAHVLSSEQVHGFPGRRTMTLRCELFGQAGDYALTLRPATATTTQDYVTAFIKADWSEQFVLNVHGGSVFPCSGAGVRALFQYPACVLERADRVRVFGKDGDRLRYIAERRVRRGQHTAAFDCRLFSERYPEYCFVYVSQAVTGAVADVRMDCIPTLPLSDGTAGGWGEWSAWSPCPAPEHCSTHTRSRHRFCDSPVPAYGAKRCEGSAVELAACKCVARPWIADQPAVVDEVGSKCRCGCILHMSSVPRLVAGSTRACPDHSFWLLQSEEGTAIRLRMEAVKLPCSGQSVRVRAGDSLGSPLLASWDGPNALASSPHFEDFEHMSDGILEVESGRQMLVDMQTVESADDTCYGGFIAHTVQTFPTRNASASWSSLEAAWAGGAWWREGGGARAAALALAAVAAVAALLLALHSAHRNRAYQRAADKDTLTDSDACSASLELMGDERGSKTTIFSEVSGVQVPRIPGVSLRRLLPSMRAKHHRLRESKVTIEDNNEIRDDEDEPEIEVVETALDNRSITSEVTVTPESVPSAKSDPSPITTKSQSQMRRCSTAPGHSEGNPEVISPDPPPSTASEAATSTDFNTSMSSMSEREVKTSSEKDRDSVWEKEMRERCMMSGSSRTSSAATLTNGNYSPALSGVCSARVRGNPKHSKERSNRRLLRTSELSLGSSQALEMEMDYYDYEVNNAGSAPGSYLGMDPAFLVWIPPIEDGDILQEINEMKGHVYQEILPKQFHPDPGSNTESPETDHGATLKRVLDERGTDTVKSMNKVLEKNLIHPLNFSISDLQKDTTRLSRSGSNRKHKEDVIPMKHLNSTSYKSPVSIHKNNDYNSKKLDLSDIRFADENSDSSNDVQFENTDSNRFDERFNV